MSRTDKADENGRLLALGQQLQQAREALSYSVAEVAERLFLSSNQVNAIEEARYDALPAEVFVKGYLKAYARLLDIDPEEVVKQYQPMAPPPAPRPVIEESTSPRKLLERMPDTPTTLVLGGAAVLVILLLASLVYFATSSDPLPEEPAAEAESDVSDGSAAAVDDEEAALLGDQGQQLEMRFSADCWVEVRDASRKILLADMRSAGDTEIVEGEPPYKIVLGKSNAVAVRYQGRFVPVVPESGKLSAQLVIGG